MATISVPHVSETFVIAKCNFFVDTHLWPLKQKLDPEGWLSNFSGHDRDYAVHLLNGFMYYSNHLVDALFVSAFRGLSKKVGPTSSKKDYAQRWSTFLEDLVVTYPTGETPSDADSGHLFVRRARDLIGIPEARIMSPARALDFLVNGNTSRIVFVDDFVGSGQQFFTTWHRSIDGLGGRSFANHGIKHAEIFYLPLFCTQLALDNGLSTLLRDVQICPAHTLSAEYSAFGEPSIFWPNSLREGARDFLYRVSMTLGLPDCDGAVSTDWQGFGKLGLGIAFEHQIPDASLPIFYVTSSGWKPLWRKAP